MIQEYYLHLLCGTSGENDRYTPAGRLAIAALMAGYGLGASTKKDLQTRVNWRVTPGCFLGQKEIQPDGYEARNYEEVKFGVSLVPFRKVNRTMNYQLDWSVINGSWDSRVTAEMWICMAKIYWLGFFFFGRNVIPVEVLAKLQELFNPTVHDQRSMCHSLKSPFVMQFMKNIGLPLARVNAEHLFTNNDEDLPRKDIFASLAFSMNFVDNIAGFYTIAALLGSDMPVGGRFDRASQTIRRYSDMRVGRSVNYELPLMQAHYYNLGMGRPSIPTSENRMPSIGRDIVPLLLCDPNRTPAEEAATSYSQVRGQGFNTEYLSYNLQTWMTAAMMWEYHLLLTGHALFPLEALTAAREAKGWTEEAIVEYLAYLNPANQKNCSVGQIVRFNLERQTQV